LANIIASCLWQLQSFECDHDHCSTAAFGNARIILLLFVMLECAVLNNWISGPIASFGLGVILVFNEVYCGVNTLASGWFWWFSQKNSSFRLPYQRPSSSADCARELFNGSNRSGSLVDCTRKNISCLGGKKKFLKQVFENWLNCKRCLQTENFVCMLVGHGAFVTQSCKCSHSTFDAISVDLAVWGRILSIAVNTLAAGLIQVVRKKQLIRTWLCRWISPLLFALATRRKSKKTWQV